MPSELKEILGTYHIKLAIFDDNILITGANLSEEYFTNRQDRYIVINKNTLLANYL